MTTEPAALAEPAAAVEDALLTIAAAAVRKYREGFDRRVAARHIMASGLRLLALQTSPSSALDAARESALLRATEWLP